MRKSGVEMALVCIIQSGKLVPVSVFQIAKLLLKPRGVEACSPEAWITALSAKRKRAAHKNQRNTIALLPRTRCIRQHIYLGTERGKRIT